MAGWLTLVPETPLDERATREQLECRTRYATAVLLSVDPLGCYETDVYEQYAREIAQRWEPHEWHYSAGRVPKQRLSLLWEIVRRSFDPELVVTGHVTDEEIRLIADGIAPLFLLGGKA